MAVLCAFGSAGVWAQQSVNVNPNETYTSDIIVESSDSEYAGLTNDGAIKNSQIVIGKAVPFKNNGTIETGKLDIYVYQTNPIEGTITATEEFIYRGSRGNNVGQDLSAKLTTPLLHIYGTDATKNNQVGLKVLNADVLAGVDKILVESNNGRTTLGFGEGDFEYLKTVELRRNSGDQDARIETNDGANLKLGTVVVTNSLGAVQVSKTSSISIQKIVVEDGAAINVGAWGDAEGQKGTFTLSDIYLGKNASLAAMEFSNSQQSEIKGQISLTLDSGATADFVRPGSTQEATLNAESLSVTVLDASSGSKVLLSKDNTLTKLENITVIGAASTNTGNISADLAALGEAVQFAQKTAGDGDTTDVVLSNVEGVKIEQLASDLFDGASAVVGKDGVEEVVVHQNTNIAGIAEMNALGLHIWRNEINDMNKRLGELRDSKASANGLWARVYTGQAEIGTQNVKNQYTTFQFGYDRQVVPNTFVGAAFSYTNGNNDFSVGGGDNSIYALTAYGSYIADNGLFVDVTAKYGWLENEFQISLADGSSSSGSYDANAFSLSAEAGWRYPLSRLFYVEPQVEMMYGRVEGVDYTTSTGLSVEHDGVDTLIGRAGFVLGLNCPDQKGNAYVRASVLHDFLGEADYSFSKNGQSRHLSDDLGGTWYEFGIGTNINWTPDIHTYLDVEASAGGEVDTDYRVNVGVRYSF